MSLVITLYVREGIVMAADSRATLNMVQKQGDLHKVNLSVAQSDTVRKLFLIEERVGISVFGEAAINGVPISGYMDSFISQLKKHQSVDEVSRAVLEFFSSFKEKPKTGFHVAGYKGEEPFVFQVLIDRGEIKKVNPASSQGAAWAGESDILTRLLQPLYEKRGDEFIPLPYFQIPWGFFTLQDAIDFASFALKTTAEAIRFMPRAKTVGGPIDVIVITPGRGFWVRRKELNLAY